MCITHYECKGFGLSNILAMQITFYLALTMVTCAYGKPMLLLPSAQYLSAKKQFYHTVKNSRKSFQKCPKSSGFPAIAISQRKSKVGLRPNGLNWKVEKPKLNEGSKTIRVPKNFPIC